ncbi:MAG TPA: HipA domain-containing protein, partial [Pseudomonadales bacterium]
VIRRLHLPMDSIEEMFRRMVFNILARNQDDHVKNTAFLMQPSGAWSLAPAYDVTYSYNPAGAWTGTHQMSLNGKRDHFEFDDLEACAASCSMKKGRAAAILRDVTAAVERWPEFAAQAGVPVSVARRIQATHRTL